MGIFTALGACLRRWYVFVPIVLIVGFLAALDVRAAQPVYSAIGRVIVLPPSATAPLLPGADVNVYAIGGGRALVAEVAAANLTSAPVVEGLLDRGAVAEFTVSTGEIGGTLEVLATGSDSEAVSTTVSLVVDEAAVVVEELQTTAGAPVDQLFVARRLAPDSPPVGETPSTIRSAATIVVIGLALAVVLSVLVDSLLLRRRGSTGTDLVVREDDSRPVGRDTSVATREEPSERTSATAGGR